MLKQRKGFTLIELLAVIAILAIILIIAVPSVMKTINNSKMHAFESNAQFVIRAMELKATQNRSFDPTTITAENIKEILNLDNSNYESIIVTFQNKEIGITIVGKNKWEGLTATGNSGGIMVFGEIPNDGANGSLVKTIDGGYIIVGSAANHMDGTINNYGSNDVFVMKFMANGTISWAKNYGGSGEEQSNSIIRTTDGGYMIAGQTDSIDGDMTGVANNGEYQTDAFLMKITSTGNIEWIKKYGGSSNETNVSVVQTDDGGYLMSSITRSSDGDVPANKGEEDILVVKVNQNGSVLWSKNYGGSNEDLVNKVIKTKDGGYLMVGITYSTDGDITSEEYTSALAIKISKTGTILWSKKFAPLAYAEFYSALETKDGGYLLTGFIETEDYDYIQGVLVIKTDSSGTTQWEKTYSGNNEDIGISAIQAHDGGYLIVGETRSTTGDITTPVSDGGLSIWLLKLNSTGTKVWDKTISNGIKNNPADITENGDGSYILVSTSGNYSWENTSAVFAKLDKMGNKMFSKINFGNVQLGPFQEWYWGPSAS